MIKKKKPMEALSIDRLDQGEEESRREPTEWLISIPLKEEDPTKTIQVGSLLSNDLQKKLMTFLWDNADIFARPAFNMPGIPSDVIVHWLNINAKCRLVR